MAPPLLPPPTRAIVRLPSSRAAEGLTDADLGAPDPAVTASQHEAYVTALRNAGLDVTVLPAEEDLPDAHYVEDAAVLLGDDLAVLTRPGAPERRAEPARLADALPHPTVVSLADVGGPEATLDGGDVLVAHDRMLIGVSRRTNEAGARALAAIVAEHRSGWPVHLVPFTGVLHLKTGTTEVVPGLLLVAPTMHITDASGLDGLQQHVLADADAYAANVVPLGHTTLVAAGFPDVAALVGRHGPITEVPMGDFERMDGGLTCLSLRW